MDLAIVIAAVAAIFALAAVVVAILTYIRCAPLIQLAPAVTGIGTQLAAISSRLDAAVQADERTERTLREQLGGFREEAQRGAGELRAEVAGSIGQLVQRLD